MTDQPITTREPVLSTATITGICGAIIATIVAFLPGALSQGQQAALLALVGVVAPVIVGVVSRRFVTPNAAVVEHIGIGSEGTPMIVAGEGSELPTGTTVREPGTLDLRDPHGRHEAEVQG